jgi:hypothetical protein
VNVKGAEGSMFAALQLIQTLRPDYPARQLAAHGGMYFDCLELTEGRSVGHVADRIEQGT